MVLGCCWMEASGSTKGLQAAPYNMSTDRPRHAHRIRRFPDGLGQGGLRLFRPRDDPRDAGDRTRASLFALPQLRRLLFRPAHAGRQSLSGSERALWSAAPVARERGRLLGVSRGRSEAGSPRRGHANNFWCPLRFAASRVIYTCYDLGFTVDPGWTTEANRVGCFEGMFRASVAADWVVTI